MGTQPKSLNFQEICGLLPHRPPLILVDRVTEMDFEKLEIKALKNITGQEPVLQGHFPGNPLFPGVYLVEGMAQASGILCFSYFEEIGENLERTCVLTTIDTAKFRKQVVPGDVLEYEVSFLRSRGNFNWFKGQAKVDGAIVAQAEFSAFLPSAVQPKGDKKS